MNTRWLVMWWWAILALFLPATIYAADQGVVPSVALLRSVDVREFSLSADVRVLVTREDIKNSKGIRIFNNGSYLPLFLSSNLTGVSAIKIAVESASHVAPAAFFSIYNHGGLGTPKFAGTVPINLAEYEKYGVINIWVFYFTDRGVFANYVQAQGIGY